MTPDGVAVLENQLLTIDQLTQLQYLSPDSSESFDGDPVTFSYSVSDQYQSVTGTVEITFAGLSRITGQVVVLDDTEESAYEGYAQNNEVRLVGEDLLGNSVDLTVLTNVNGEFEFSEVAPGVYQIEQTQPPTIFDGYVAPGEVPGTAGQNQVVDVTIPTDPQSFDGLTFYEEAPTQISGFVYIDGNGNGRIDVEEAGIANVQILVEGVDNTGEPVERSATTDSYGFYEFRNLRSGTYKLTQVQPESFISAETNVGDLGGIASQNQIDNVVTSPGQLAANYHFGEYETGSIRGSVFLDNDIDNSFDQGDLALTDVLVQLTGTDIFGNQISRDVPTNVLGDFLFDNLVAGVYDLELEAVDGLPDGRAHVGIFDNDETVLSTNGSADTDRISGIETGVGRHGRSFNFSKRPTYRLVEQFDTYVEFVGTNANDEFQFIAGDEIHQVLFNGVAYEYDAGINTHFSFDGISGSDRVFIVGTEKAEQARVSETFGSMTSENWRVDFSNFDEVRVESGGGYDLAFLDDTEQDDRLKMTQDYARMWNDSFYVETRGFHRTYAYAKNGGEDRVYHYDSKYDDTIKMTSHNSRMIGRKFYNFAGQFERNYAYSLNGGQDRAQLWDSYEDHDVFEGRPDYGRLYNDHFYNFADGFAQLDVFGVHEGGSDRAFLRGSEGEDVLLSSPARSGLAGQSYRYDVHRFERVYAYSEGGEKDRAYLFDSKLDDRFVGGPTEAKLYNDEYFLKAVGFSQVDAYSSKGGNDRAYFNDSEGDDTLITLEGETRMLGDEFDNTSHGFSRTYVRSLAGGNDQALLYDTQYADTIKISDDVSKMYGENYYTWLLGFSEVTAEFAKANRYDRALVFGDISEATLSLSGELSSMVFEHAIEFVHDSYADSENEYGPDEFEQNSILELLADFDLDKD